MQRVAKFFVKLFRLIALNRYIDLHDGSLKESITMITVTATGIILQKQNALKEMPSK